MIFLNRTNTVSIGGINLKIKDVINIDMRRLVFLDGSMWRINRIVDFSPAKNVTTKVELIQWFEV